MIKLSKTEYFDLLFCIYHGVYKKLEKYLYDQSKLNLCTYKIMKGYKFDKSILNMKTYKMLENYKFDQSGLKMYTYKISNYKYDKSKLI